MPAAVTVETNDNVLTITWNDPDRLNGMTGTEPMDVANRLIRAVVASPVPVVAAVDRERDGQVALFATADFAEGASAFMHKRAPKFAGR